MSNLTPLLLIAGVGLLKNSGIAVSRDLTTSANTFNSSGVSAAVQAAYARADDEGKSILSLLPVCLTGLPPDGVDRAAGASSNVVGDILTTASSIVSKGVQGVASLIGQASSYAATTFGFQGAIAMAQGKKFDDLGFTFGNFNDMTSCGVTSQFSAESVAGLGTEMARLGTLFDVADLYNLANPGTICASVIRQGYGYAGSLYSKLEDAGLDLENLPYESPDVIISIMSTVEGQDLEDIFGGTEFNPFNPLAIRSLADVLDINNVMGPDITSEIDTFEALANKLGNIGGNFGTAAEMGDFYASLEIKSFPTLAALGTLVPDSLVGDLSPIVGSGSGPFQNPTATDILGSAAGIGYTDNIQHCVQVQQDLLANNSNVRNLVDYLESNLLELDNAMLSVLVTNINEDWGIQEVLADGNDSMINAASQLTTEKKNQQIAGCKFGDDMLAGSVGGVMSMTTQLPGLALDPMNLGVGSMLSNMATDGAYGDALQASIVESRNLSRFTVFGIEPGQKMDPMAYAQQLNGMRG